MSYITGSEVDFGGSAAQHTTGKKIIVTTDTCKYGIEAIFTHEQERFDQLVCDGYHPLYSDPSAKGFMSAEAAGAAFGECKEEKRFVILGEPCMLISFVMGCLAGVFPMDDSPQNNLLHITETARNVSIFSKISRQENENIHLDVEHFVKLFRKYNEHSKRARWVPARSKKRKKPKK